jgi:hypothetical protein
MTHLILVIPADDGWAVRSASLGAEIGFRSGAQAEAMGRQVAQRFAMDGEAAELQIFLRDGTLAGRSAFGASRAA